MINENPPSPTLVPLRKFVVEGFVAEGGRAHDELEDVKLVVLAMGAARAETARFAVRKRKAKGCIMVYIFSRCVSGKEGAGWVEKVVPERRKSVPKRSEGGEKTERQTAMSRSKPSIFYSTPSRGAIAELSSLRIADLRTPDANGEREVGSTA
jgi:hypothetical protein